MRNSYFWLFDFWTRVGGIFVVLWNITRTVGMVDKMKKKKTTDAFSDLASAPVNSHLLFNSVMSRRVTRLIVAEGIGHISISRKAVTLYTRRVLNDKEM